MTIWTLISYAPAIIALWNRMGRTPFNDFAMWGGIIAEVVALIARMNGFEVPAVTDVGAIGIASGGAVHKDAVANAKGFQKEWAKKALGTKD